MIASKVICDDTYSNQSWSIVAQKMFALKEINQMEREMCSYLEWNLNVMGDEVVDFEARIRAEHGPGAVPHSASLSPEGSYPTPESTPDPQMVARPIRPVPSPYKNKSSYQAPPNPVTLPSPPPSPGHYYQSPHSPQPPPYTSAYSSLASSPASDNCKTPSPVTQTSSGSSACSRIQSAKGVDVSRAFDGRHHRHPATNITLSGYQINVGGW